MKCRVGDLVVVVRGASKDAFVANIGRTGRVKSVLAGSTRKIEGDWWVEPSHLFWGWKADGEAMETRVPVSFFDEELMPIRPEDLRESETTKELVND